MNENVIYAYEDFSVTLVGPPENLLRFVDEYTYFQKDFSARTYSVTLTFLKEEVTDRLYHTLPEDAVLKTDSVITLDGTRHYLQYEKTETQKWYFYENYGAVYMDFEKNEIQSICCMDAQVPDVSPFILLFIHPMIRVMRNCGYQYLHAACLKVCGKSILISGLSGRGKSTAACALIAKGHRALTDESTLMRRESGIFHACTITNWIKVRKDAKDRFFGSFEKGHLISDDDYIMKLGDLYEQPITRLDDIHDIFILEQTGKSETTIEGVNALAVVPELLPISLNVSNKCSAQREFAFVMEFLEQADCHKVFFGTDMEHFAKEVEKTLMQE